MAHRAASRVNWATFSPLFWLLATLYLGHRATVWLDFPRPSWLQFYLDDLLCLPLLLTVTLFLMRLLYGPRVRFTVYHVLFVVTYVSLVFECLLPTFMPRYTADLWDVLCYALGGGIFHRFLNR
ncbi:hypothetical protein [Rufibacter immobilis]|uniref:hypothetical protein n=1 Tax=Rufibacter immobilis TaxID=1348778 RepID=UPI0011CDA79A|nr:hypothetical protein [Rufibacter immobilis]